MIIQHSVISDLGGKVKVVEEWRDVVGYEGLYQVSSHGQVRSVDRIVKMRHAKIGWYERQYPGAVLSAAPMDSGHLQVSLSKNGKAKSMLVHILELEAFVGPRPGDSTNWQGCHGDGDPANNHLWNLRWDTRSGNEMDKVAHGTSNRGVRNRAAKLSEDQAKEIKSRIVNGEASSIIAANYGVTRGLINAIKRGDAWSWI